MRSTFYGIEIGRTGVNISQKGLDVTGHNIANVDTDGYTRQRLITTAYDPAHELMKFKTLELGAVGGGVQVKILDQIRSSFLDRQYRTESTYQSYWSTRTSGLSYVESLFEGEDIATVGSAISNLFSMFNTLSTEANDSQQRIVVRSAAEALCDSLGQVHDRLVEQQESQNLAVETVIKQINDMATNISQLNDAIYKYEMDNQPANDLRDKRNLLLDQMSELVDITYYETPDNKMVVQINGQDLVNFKTVTKLGTTPYVDTYSGNTYSSPCWVDDNGDPLYTDSVTGDPITLTADQLKGELGAHMDLRDNDTADTPGIPYFIKQLNTLARALAEKVNEVHTKGYTHPSNGTGSVQGVNFFDDNGGDYSGITAKNIRVSDEVKESEYNIAASTIEIILAEPNSDNYLQEGNNENALALFELFNQKDLKLSDGTGIGSFIGFMNGLVLEVATTKNQSGVFQSNHATQLLSVENQRTSISGVSLDEEMTNLIKYQHAYSGASRVITAMDEALEKLINGTGRVGL